MSRFKAANEPALDERVLDQALKWIVTLQSGTCGAAEQQACHHWRNENPLHELAWQRLAGLSRDLRLDTLALSAPGARQLLRARSAPSRRTLLKGFAGLSVATALGLSVRERVLLPAVFSDYHTATGERRVVRLADAVELQLDTRTAVDSRGTQVVLNLGRLLVTSGASGGMTLQTADGWIRPAALSRLVISHHLPGQPDTGVQVLAGSASVQPLQGIGSRLGAAEQLTFNRINASQPVALSPAADAWTHGLLIAERMPLGALLAQLDRYRPGVLRCDPAVAGLQVSGSFSVDQPEASLALLTKVLPVRVERVFGYLATVVPA